MLFFPYGGIQCALRFQEHEYEHEILCQLQSRVFLIALVYIPWAMTFVLKPDLFSNGINLSNTIFDIILSKSLPMDLI